MPIFLPNTLLKIQLGFDDYVHLIGMVGKGPMHSSTEGAWEKAI
jgi:hypothetical protein